MIEYREFRCCMCPNINKRSYMCPGIPNTSHPEISVCRFVKSYKDHRGWAYAVMSGIGGDTYKARYNKPGKSSWKGVTSLPWRIYFDEAQADLNRLAKEKGWEELK